MNTLTWFTIGWKTRLKLFPRPFYSKSRRKFFETGVFGMGRSGYMKRQYFLVLPKVLHISSCTRGLSGSLWRRLLPGLDHSQGKSFPGKVVPRGHSRARSFPEVIPWVLPACSQELELPIKIFNLTHGGWGGKSWGVGLKWVVQPEIVATRAALRLRQP